MGLDTTNLSKFLEGITDAIRKKKGSTGKIQHSKIDEEIESIDTDVGYKEWAGQAGDAYSFYEHLFLDDALEKLQKCGLKMRCGDPRLFHGIDYAFYYCRNITKIPKINLSYALLWSDNLFTGCSSLKIIEDEFICSAFEYYSNKKLYADLSTTNFLLCDKLEYVGVAKETLFLDSDLSWCANLNAECRQSLIHGLAKVEEQRTFRFHSSVVKKFTDEQILEATNKNWNIG